MAKAKRARIAETPKQPSLCLRLRAPHFYPDHTVPKEASNESKRQRRKYGDMAVGLTHSRGVNGVILIESQEFGTLEGVSSKAQRDE